MNKEKVAKIKSFYEDGVKNAVVELLGENIKDNIIANWTLDETTVVVDVSTQDIVNIFTFKLVDDNLIISSEGYGVLFNQINGQKYINGIFAKPSVIDYNSLTQLKEKIEGVLSQDYCEPDCCESSADEQCNAAEDASEE